MIGPEILIIAAFAYLAGSIPFGLLVTRLGGKGDIRAIGSDVIRGDGIDGAVGNAFDDGLAVIFRTKPVSYTHLTLPTKA